MGSSLRRHLCTYSTAFFVFLIATAPSAAVVPHLACCSNNSLKLFMLFHNEWKINTCLIWGNEIMALCCTRHPLQRPDIAKLLSELARGRGLNDSAVANGELGLNTPSVFYTYRRRDPCISSKWTSQGAPFILAGRNLVTAEWSSVMQGVSSRSSGV